MNNKKVKILYLITGLARAGAEMQMLRIITGLDKRKFETVVVSMKSNGTLREAYLQNNIKLYELNMKSKRINLNEIFKLYRIIKFENPDILNTFMFHANILGRILNAFLKVKISISSIRTSNYTNRIRRFLEKRTHKLNDLVTVNSSLVAKKLVEEKLVSRDKLKVIPNGLDPKEYYFSRANRDRMRKNLNISNTEYVWIAVGRLYEAKNYPLLLNAFKLIVSKYPHTRLLIVGEGPLEDECKNITRDLQIESKVDFLGLREDISKLLNIADSYVLSSAWEGMPNALVEAAFTSLPIVATDVGEVARIIINNSTGFLVKPKDLEGLFNAMDKLMTLSIEDRKLIGEKGRWYIEEKYDIRKIVKIWEIIYMDLYNSKLLREL